MPAVSTQCIVGTEKYPDSWDFLKYKSDDYSQGCDQVKNGFRALIEDDVVQPYISYEESRTTNDGKDNGYNLYVFVIN